MYKTSNIDIDIYSIDSWSEIAAINSYNTFIIQY